MKGETSKMGHFLATGDRGHFNAVALVVLLGLIWAEILGRGERVKRETKKGFVWEGFLLPLFLGLRPALAWVS